MFDQDGSAPLVRRRPSGLAGFNEAGAALTLEDGLGVGKVQFLRETTVAYFSDLFGQPAPADRQSLALDMFEVSWLAPDEWLLTGDEAEVLAMIGRAAMFGDSCLATNLSHARAAFRLSGAGARDRLAAVTPLDVTDAAMSVGDVARAPLSDTGMFIARLPNSEGQPVFRIVIDQTMAAYAIRMLRGPALTSGADS